MSAHTPSSAQQPGSPAATQAGSLAVADGEGARALASFLAELLARQGELTGADAALAFIASGERRAGGVAAAWHGPDGRGVLARVRGQDGAVHPRVAALADRVISQGAPEAEGLALGTDPLYDTARSHEALCVPLRAQSVVEGACVVLIPAARADRGRAQRLLELAADRFEGFLWAQRCVVESERATTLAQTLELLDAAARGPTARAMASMFCDELRRRFGCTRVSLGLVEGHELGVVAVSGADTVDRRNPAVEALAAAMEECADQDIEVLYPQPEGVSAADRRVVRAHGELSERFGPSSIVSLPLRVDGDLVGVAVLERAPDDPFPPGSLGLLRLVAEFVGPAVWTRRLADRGVLAVARDRARELGSVLVGPRHTLLKLVGALALLVLLAVAFVPVPRVVAADATAKASSRRVVTPPYEGFLAWAGVSPGDRVRAGEEIARMDTVERRERLATLDAQLAGLRAEREGEQAGGRIDRAAVLAARIDELAAQRRLLEVELGRASIRAPIDGRVAGEDLEPWLDAPVGPDNALVEIVGERSVVVLEVPERDIAVARALLDNDDRRPDGSFAARARPGDRLPLRLVRINPRAEAVEGGNAYLVEAELVGDEPDWLRPGMTGRGRLEAGWTTTLARIVGPLVDRAHMAWWW